MSLVKQNTILISGLFCMFAGCAPRVTPIGPGFIYQPEEDEKRLWQTTENISQSMQGSGGLYRDENLRQYCQGVLDRLLGEYRGAYVPLKPRVFILDASTPNACTFPHGDVYVNSGMIGRMRNEAQLAMLLGHEITHATHRHGYQTREHAYDATGASAYLSVLSAMAGSNTQRGVSQIGGVVTIAAISGYSRDKEEEADRVGLTLVAQAGYDPAEGAKMFARMCDATDPKSKEQSLLYATHPRMKSRVEFCVKTVNALPPELLATAKEIGDKRYVEAALELILAEVDRHTQLGKFNLAEETVQYLSSMDSTDSRVMCAAGDLYRVRNSEGDNERARSEYQRAMQSLPNSAAPRRGMGLLCARTGPKSEAIEHLNAYLSLAPNAADASYIRQYVDQLSRGGR